MIKTCQTCGNEFEAKHQSFRYCNKDCSPIEIKRNKKRVIIGLYGNNCAYCGLPLDSLTMHIDHIIPKSQGGTDEIDNLTPCCPMCNLAKGTMSADMYLDWLSYIRSDEFNSPLIDRLNDK